MTVTTGEHAPGRSRSRRAVLAAATLGVLGLGGTAAALVGRDAFGPDDVAGAPDVEPGPIEQGGYESKARGLAVRWVLAYPPGHGPDDLPGRLPVCLVLHGRGDDAGAMLRLGYPQFLAAAVRAGVPPFALASIDGGESYWHRRASGDDPPSMLLVEFLPALARRGLAAGPRDRFGLLGWSMGGYGSLLLASRLGRSRVAAVVAESPALWQRASLTSAGSFDDREDYLRNDVFTRTARLAGIPIRIDCGGDDPFYGAAKAFAADLRKSPGGIVRTDFGPGAHNSEYWQAKAAKSIGFIGNALVR